MFKHYILEMAQARKGNWTEAAGYFLSITSKLVINMDTTKIDDINIPKLGTTLELRKYKDSEHYILGKWEKEEIETKEGLAFKDIFVVVFFIKLSKTKINIPKYNVVYNVDEVGVNIAKKLNGNGISQIIYQYIVNDLGYVILGDSEQYFGARKLWSVLSKKIDLTVDIVNIKTNEIEYENTILYHGDYNNDFDKRLWSFSKDKHYIRSVLTKVSY